LLHVLHDIPAFIEKCSTKCSELQEKFNELLRGLSDVELTDAERDKLFTYVAGESASMTKEIFTEPWQDLGTYLFFGNQRFFGLFCQWGRLNTCKAQEMMKLYYTCIKSTVMSEELSIKSKQVRRLELPACKISP